MTGVPKDGRGYEHLVRRADVLLEQSLSAAAGDRLQPALLGFRSVLALIDLSRADGAAVAPPALKGHMERIQRAAERELARLDPTFTPTLPPRQRPEPRPAPRPRAKPPRRTVAPAPPAALSVEQSTASADARVPLARIAAGASPEERGRLLARVAEIAADPGVLPANDAAWLPGALRQVQPSVAELSPIVAALMSRADVRRSKAVLQHLGELCLDREAAAAAGPVLAELQERFPGDLVVRRLLARRDALA